MTKIKNMFFLLHWFLLIGYKSYLSIKLIEIFSDVYYGDILLYLKPIAFDVIECLSKFQTHKCIEDIPVDLKDLLIDHHYGISTQSSKNDCESLPGIIIWLV